MSELTKEAYLRDQQKRQWIHLGVYTIGGLLYVAGGVFVFLTITFPNAEVDRKLKDVDSRLKNMQTATADFDLKAKQAMQEIDARKKMADTKLAELKAKQANAPLLTVRADVQQTRSVDDMREIILDTHFANVGTAKEEISTITIEVFEAKPKPEVIEILRRTKEIYNIRMAQHVSPSPTALYESEGDADSAPEMTPTEAWDAIENDFGCPHGRLYAIDERSEDIEWRPLTNLTRKRSVRITLKPDQSTFFRSVYLLTEYPNQHHKQWFRFHISVKTANSEDTQDFDHYVSGLPLPLSEQHTAKLVYETKQVTHRPVTVSTLLPTTKPVTPTTDGTFKTPPGTE